MEADLAHTTISKASWSVLRIKRKKLFFKIELTESIINSLVNQSGIELRWLTIQWLMASIAKSVGIQMYKLFISHEQNSLPKFEDLAKNL